MRIRLGYVAMVLGLHDCSPSGTVTYTALSKLPDMKAKLYRLRKVAEKNLDNTLRILRYNKAYDIKVYRLTSKLIPLATHPELTEWDYTADFADKLRELGDFIKDNDFRVSAHPDHFTLLNSPSEKVFEDSLRDLDYHVKIFEAMGLGDCRYKLVLHVGGLYGKKGESIERFLTNFTALPERIKCRIILENDDKSYTASDVLGICTQLSIPMVLDVHHHKCVNGGESLEELLPSIFSTWKGGYFGPKVHFSSPRGEKDFRSHADFIEFDEFIQFLNSAKAANTDFDVMLEAKNKDQALIQLSGQLRGYPGVRFINEGEFEL